MHCPTFTAWGNSENHIQEILFLLHVTKSLACSHIDLAISSSYMHNGWLWVCYIIL